jgi:ABC-2 type transport system ATP-binding protein
MGPVVIEVRDVEKTFRIPSRPTGTILQWLRHPLEGAGYRELRALRGVSFDVGRGEFFGIVGRNGSGKSTLLKILASIYGADAGRVRMAGRLAPFIELGVGFNVELTARENVALNGVMMGLGRREAARKLDSVLEFAELREFVDLKLKNYSSGMLVRLAFAVMVEADADIMLVDEVLAVGDASFAQKCVDVFRDKRRAGKTLVLVTHDMATVQGFCDRALVIHDGEQLYLGDPEEAALRYYRLNFPGERSNGAWVRDPALELVAAWMEGAAGRRTTAVRQGEPIRLGLVVEARRALTDPAFAFQVLDANGALIFGFGKALNADEEEPVHIAPGRRLRITGELENPLVAGRYSLACSISRNRTPGDIALRLPQLIEFTVNAPQPTPVAIEDHPVGMVTVREDLDAIVER